MDLRARQSMTSLTAAWLASLLLLPGVAADAAVLEIEQLPRHGQLASEAAAGAGFAPAVEALQRGDAKSAEKLARSYVAQNPANARAHLLLLLSWYPQLEDVQILEHLEEVDQQLPAEGAALHESMAGLYLQDVRLHRATQHLNAIPPTRKSPQAQFLEANIAARQGRLDDALRKYGELSKEVPDNAVIALNQARLALLAQDYATTEAAARRLLRVQPGDEGGQLLLGTAQMHQGKTAEARKSFAAVSEKNPRSSLAWLNIGLIDLADAEYSEAASAFTRARTAAVGDPRPMVAAAAAALAEGDRGKAGTAAAAAREAAPGDPLAALLDVLARGEGVTAPGAATSLALAGHLFPDLARTPLPAAVLPELLDTGAAGQLAVANVLSQYWSAAAALDWMGRQKFAVTPSPLLELTRVRALASNGELTEASEALARLESDPASKGLISPTVMSAQAAVRLNDKAAASATMQRALAAAPGDAHLHRLAGDLYNAIGQPDEAVPEYRAALKASPRDPRLHNQLAATLALTGGRAEFQQGLRLADAGLALKPDYMTRALLLDTRADLLFRLGREADALAAYRELSTTVGGITGPSAWHRLGELSLAAGDQAGARKAFEEALDYGRDYSQRPSAVAELDKLSPPEAP